MNTSTTPDSWELRDYVRVLRRRWFIVLGLTCVGALAAGAALKFLPKTYSSTAVVYVAALPTDPLAQGGGPVSVDMDTEAQLAQTAAVTQLAAHNLRPSPTTKQLSNAVSVTVLPNTTVLDIACKESTSRRAADCANAVAAAYLSTRRTDATNLLKSEVAAVQSKTSSMMPVVAKLNLQLREARSASSAAYVTLRLQAKAARNQLTALVTRMNTLSAELASLEAPHNTTAGHVANAAGRPSSQSSPKPLLLLPSGLVAGLLLGLTAAFWADSRDKRFHEPRDVERAHGVPTLLDLGAKRRRAARNLITAVSQPPPAFDELAEYVAAIPSDRSLVLLVGGASPEAVSVVAANLAVALSQGRPGVFLVCAGPEATLGPELLGLPHRSGLAELLAGSAPIDEVALSPEGLPDLRVIGPGLQNPSAALHHNYDARRQLMAGLRSHARYAIVESPVTGGEPPVFTLAEFADGAVAVIESSRTKRGDVDRWLRHLERIRVPVLGTALIPRLDRALRSRSRRAQLAPRRAAEETGDTVAVRA